jgi:hypothetical protein
MIITLDTALWGTINIDVSNGFAEYAELTTNGTRRKIWLDIFEDISPITPVDKIIDLLDSVPACERIIQGILDNKVGENACVDEFLEEMQECDEETLQELNITNPTRQAFVSSLILRGVIVGLEAPAPGTLTLTLDYGLPEEFSDQLLVFTFDEKAVLLGVSWES